MKNSVTNRFLTFSIISTIMVIFFSSLIIYLILSGKDGDLTTPKKLTIEFGYYIQKDEDGNLFINQAGKEILLRSNGWIQLLDVDGHEVYSFNKPSNILSKYTPYELLDSYLYNKKGFTNFVYKFDKYTIYTGFPANDNTKIMIDISDDKEEIFLSFLIIIFAVGFIIYLIMGRIFSKKITGPIDLLVYSIDNLDRISDKDADRRKFGMFENVFDNLKALQSRLQIARMQERDFEKQRNEWIANISHDLKTPLSSISGYSELMADEKYQLSRAEYIKYSEIIRKQTRNIEHLINDLSLEIKIKSMEDLLNKQVVKLNNFLKELVISTLNNYQYSDRDISFEEKGEVYLEIDKELFGRAITNLITNALKHSGEKAEVKVVLEKSEEGRGIIKIVDNGKGISRKILDKLFVRYYRGESTEEVEGTGLGMSIAKNVIEAHGGKIKVDSEIDKGTTITIEF